MGAAPCFTTAVSRVQEKFGHRRFSIRSTAAVSTVNTIGIAKRQIPPNHDGRNTISAAREHSREGTIVSAM